MYMAGTST